MRYLGRRNMLARIGVALVLNVGFAVGVASTAQGSFLVRITTSSFSDLDQLTIADQGPFDANALEGSIQVIENIGVYSVVFHATSKPIFPASSAAALMLWHNPLSISVIGGIVSGSVVIEVTDTDFPAMPLGGTMSIAAHYTTSGGDAIFFARQSSENLEFAGATFPDRAIDLDHWIGAGTFSGSDTEQHGPIGPHSMTMQAIIGFPTASQVTFSELDFFRLEENSQVVSEPSILLLLGAGLIALGVRRLKK